MSTMGAGQANIHFEGGCPDDAWIASFARGQSAESEIPPFESHLDRCERCLDRVAEAARGAGTPQDGLERDSLWIHLVAAFACWSNRLESGDVPVRAPPERFGPYRVVGEIGRGAMGVVYSTTDERSSIAAAVKTVIAPTARSLAALRHEIAFLRRVRHPNIVRVRDDGIADGDPWYAMDLLEGGTLASLNQSLWRAPAPSAMDSGPNRMSPSRAAGGRLNEVLTLFARLCSPLAAVHSAGIVHCDLKPSNVFVQLDATPVLVDFGLLSRADGAIGRETLEVGGFRGTLPYLAPEIVRGRIPDARADLYAFGCMLYESVTGRPPFVASTPRGLLQAHLYAEPIAPSRLVSGLNAELDELVSALLAKDPERRVGSAELLEEHLHVLARTPSRPPPSPRRPYLFRPKIVGRSAQVNRIDALAREVRCGRGQVALIGGESGIGKTFLASEVARRCARSGFEVVTGECTAPAPVQDVGQQRLGRALEPFRGLLQRAGDLCHAGGEEITRELFAGEGEVQLLARYEPALRDIVSKIDPEPVSALPPLADRERVLESMLGLLARLAAKTPLLIIIDDLQWADDLSLALLASITVDFLAENAVLILALYRAEDAHEIRALRSAVHVHDLDLGRLDELSLAAMIDDMLSRPAPPALLRALMRHAEGNPFFVAEYLRAAATQGLLVHTADGWRLSEHRSSDAHGVEDLPLPGSLRELLAHRLQLLSVGARNAAETAAVLGRQFRIATLKMVAEAADDALAEWIDEMIERQLVERVRGADVRFAHEKIRELAYARLTVPRRRALHIRAAQVLENGPTAGHEPGAERHAEIAYHFRNGGAPARAVDHFELAAEHAMQNSANEDAIRLFNEAIDSSQGVSIPAVKRARWTRRIGDAYQGLGELSKSKSRLLEALALLERPMPESPGQMGFGLVQKVAQQLVHRAVPLRWLHADVKKRKALLETAGAYDRLTQIYYYLGDYERVFFANLATLNVAERLPPTPTRAVGYTNVGATAGILGLSRLADLYFGLAESTLEEAYDPEVESYFRVLLGHCLTGRGEWEKAMSASDRVRGLAERLLFRRRWEEGAGLRCNIAWGRDFGDCLMWCDRMLESAVKRRDSHTTSWGHLRRAEIHAALGELHLAEQSLAHAEVLVDALGEPERVRAFGVRAYLAHARGDFNRSLTAATNAARSIGAMKAIDLLCVEPCARVAEVYLAAWARDPSASASKDQAFRSCRDLGKAAKVFAVALPRYHLHEGTRLWLSGQRDAALTQWERGRSRAATLGMAFDEAQLCLLLAHHSGNLRSGGALAEHAAALLGRLGVRSRPHEGRLQPVE